MNNNIGLLINMMKSGGNPQQMVANMLQQQCGGNNPMIQNIMNMVNNGDQKGLENIARNLCKSKNINPDEMMKHVHNTYGL